MPSIRRWRIILFGCLLLLAISPRGGPVHARAAAYQITTLGTLGGPMSNAIAINNRGQIAGTADLKGGKVHHAFLWQAGVLTDLGTLSGPNSGAAAINAQGEVVGVAELAGPGDSTAHFCESVTQSCHGFLWKTGVLHDLGTLGGTSSQALGINDRGQIVGNSETTVPRQGSPFLWQNGHMTTLGSLFNQYSAAGASMINNAGAILGIFGTVDGTSHHAFLWYKHTLTDLGVGNGSASDAYTLNNQGQVAGAVVLADNVTTHACIWYKGKIQYLPTSAGDQGSFPNQINDAGLVVGSSYKGQTFSRAVLWRSGRVFDLNSLIPAGSGWHLDAANGINLQGQIVGQGTIRGKHLAFLLTPSLGS